MRDPVHNFESCIAPNYETDFLEIFNLDHAQIYVGFDLDGSSNVSSNIEHSSFCYYKPAQHTSESIQDVIHYY